MERATITSTCYYTYYRTFCLSLAWFVGYLPLFSLRKYQYTFFINLTVKRGNP